MDFDFGDLYVDGEKYGGIAIFWTAGRSIDHIETFPTNKLGKQRLTIGEVEFLGNDIELRIKVRKNNEV